MNLPVEVMEAVRSRRCVLFLGSRAALEAAELKDEVYPDAKTLAGALGWKKPRPVPGAGKPKPVAASIEEGAQEYETKNGREKLLAFLKEQVGTDLPISSAYPHALKRFPLIFTTCLDDTLERAAIASGTRLTVMQRTEPIPTTLPEGSTLIRLRGGFDQPSTVLVTKKDLDGHALGADQRKALRSLIRNHVVLFVGYRPDEEEFERLFAELSDAYGGELPRCHLAVAQGAIDDFLWQKWVWRGLLMFMADPTEALNELENRLQG
jgi:hypothetical protein